LHGEPANCHAPKFRITCNRGGKHNFSTDEAAKALAAGVQEIAPAWSPSLTQFDVEVVAHLHFDVVSIAFSLAIGERKRLHQLEKQKVAESQDGVSQAYSRGATTLQTDLAYGMLVAASFGSWNILVDPMCGSNVIAETALRVGVQFCIVGDSAAVAIEKTARNALLLPLTSRLPQAAA